MSIDENSGDDDENVDEEDDDDGDDDDDQQSTIDMNDECDGLSNIENDYYDFYNNYFETSISVSILF